MERADYAHWNSADVARLLALLESERRYYQEIVAGIPVGLLVVTSDLRVASANAAFRRMFNLQSADAFRGSLELLLPREILDRVLEVLRTGRPQFGARITTRPDLGGKLLRIGIRPMTGWDLDNPREALISMEDLSDVQVADKVAEDLREVVEEVVEAAAEQAAEQEAAEAAAPEEQITVVVTAPPEDSLPVPPERALVNNLDAAVWAVELPGMHFIFASEGAVRVLGYPAEYWMDHPNFWSERIDPADREVLLARYIEAVAGDGHYSGEFRARAADGRTVWLHESARVMDGGDGTRYMIGFSVEVSERREADNSRVARERLEALKALSARLSHDLNNLLMIVTGYTEDALAGVRPDSAAHTGLTNIRAAGARLATIASQLRTFAIYAPGEPDAVELNALLARVQSRVANGRVRVRPAADQVWARADAAELAQAIEGVIARSLAAMREAGEVTLGVAEHAGFPAIEIRDSAPRLEAGERSTFFEQLLGGLTPAEDALSALARAYIAVEHWGGHISIVEADAGNVVIIALHHAEAPPAVPQEQPETASAPVEAEAPPEPRPDEPVEAEPPVEAEAPAEAPVDAEEVSESEAVAEEPAAFEAPVESEAVAEEPAVYEAPQAPAEADAPSAAEPTVEAEAPAAPEAPEETSRAAEAEAPAEAAATIEAEAPAETETPAPVAEPPKPVAAAPETKEPRPLTILVVEDEAGIRALVRKILERHNYIVLDAPKAAEALALVENHSIDLIITDVVMPDMSGQQLVQQLRSVRPEVRVLFISGYTDDTSMYTREFGAGTAFLQKPFTLGALVGKVRDVLGGE